MSLNGGSSYQACLTIVLQFEGGYIFDQRDPGGATNMGITAATLAAWRKTAVTPRDVEDLTLEEASSIYHAQYWLPVCGDQLPAPIALATFDSAVNCGPPRAGHWLQAAAGAAQDGVIGTETLKAVRATASAQGAVEVATEVLARRLVFSAGLPTWRTFGNGWSRRLMRLAAKAAVM